MFSFISIFPAHDDKKSRNTSIKCCFICSAVATSLSIFNYFIDNLFGVQRTKSDVTLLHNDEPVVMPFDSEAVAQQFRTIIPDHHSGPYNSHSGPYRSSSLTICDHSGPWTPRKIYFIHNPYVTAYYLCHILTRYFVSFTPVRYIDTRLIIRDHAAKILKRGRRGMHEAMLL